MADKKIYVRLETPIRRKYYYYCISDKTMYESDEDSLFYRKPLLYVAIVIGLTLLALVVMEWGTSGGANNVQMGISLLFALSIAAISIITIHKRRGKDNLRKSEKTFSSFRIDLPLIKEGYRAEMLFVILGFIVTAFIVWVFEPIIDMLAVSLYLIIFYAFVFDAGIFHKKIVIKLLEKDESGYSSFH